MSKNKYSANMHRLVRVTLINWYLFDYEDIAIDVDVALFKGVNGAGKSSLADALQTIFAGGDENKIALNAASGDNKQSGRSILSYVLGVVAESGGMRAVQPRKVSNCYLSVTFQRPDNSYYSFGLSLFARTGDKKVKKERFIIDGLDLSSMDFMDGSNTIVPWSTMQKRLQLKPATVSFPNNALDYRRQYCELMSGSGTSQQIASNMMLQAFKNGIAFKEEKSINDFIWNYILPKRAIDVDRIENDYSEYQQIEELITTTEEKLSLLKKIVSSYNRYKQRNESVLAYQWCELEA
ncbi:ATP-binding protein, partial [Pseudoalteromonas tetraodonis]|uniref:ATP-binding protein n=1 Tax=Pseudoalteromonas tetraodonis TaxID=43659 RepID=UPI0030016061